jgi:hypothetical protein
MRKKRMMMKVEDDGEDEKEKHEEKENEKNIDQNTNLDVPSQSFA